MKYENENMIFLPVSLNITNREILFIGGGAVALNKITRLLAFTKNIRVVAKEVSPQIKDLGLCFTEKAYESSDLNKNSIVYACTNEKKLNEQVYSDAHKLGILVNVVDNPPQCDFASPAIFKQDNMTVAVSSNGQDVHRSIRLRDKIKKFLQHGSAHKI